GSERKPRRGGAQSSTFQWCGNRQNPPVPTCRRGCRNWDAEKEMPRPRGWGEGDRGGVHMRSRFTCYVACAVAATVRLDSVTVTFLQIGAVPSTRSRSQQHKPRFRVPSKARQATDSLPPPIPGGGPTGMHRTRFQKRKK